MPPFKNFFVFLLLFGNCMASFATERAASTATISASEIVGFDRDSEVVKHLLNNALLLTTKKITYRYGSADPDSKGMDCSGTIYYLLHQLKLNLVPRSSDQQYLWAKQHGKLHLVHSTDFNSPEFAALHPGDLLFWEGTYAIKRFLAITHVMIYLGKNKLGERLMVGASDGRTYQSKTMWGVSVFDFKLPAATSKSRFVGYSCIPDCTC
jgi:hypothetical protein